MRYRWGLLLMSIPGLWALWPAAAQASTLVFHSTGAEQTFTVPAGVLSIHVVAIGGEGGSAAGTLGGLGEKATADLSVTPREVLYVEVGGNGGSGTGGNCVPGAGGFNGGGSGGSESSGCDSGAGGGGGASDVRTVSTMQTGSLSSRLVVAGAGGGAAAAYEGGAAGQAGLGPYPGQPGTSSAGGAGGTNGTSSAGAGHLGTGGAGGNDSGGIDAGGGGGAGLYGGGGGLNGGGMMYGASGGGGGSSGFASSARNTSVIADTTGVPSITFTYTVTLHTLTVAKAGSGKGTVTSSDGHISCGSSCSHSYPADTSVTLRATAASGSSFAGWSGAGCSGTSTCKVVMRAAEKVTATFKAKPPDTSITKAVINTSAGKATFSFRASGAATGFQCALTSKAHPTATFTSCTSPKTYTRLRPGSYVFEVRAVGPGGPDPTPDKQSFKIA